MIVIDKFLNNPNRIREEGLELSYTKSVSPGWRGFRCLYTNMPGYELDGLIRDKLNELDPKFINSTLRCYFHYTLNENMSDTTHIDGIFDFAGVLYLTPHPPPNSGTVFFNDENEEIDYVENQYNRLTIYPSNIPHRIKESFGDNINNGRLVYTVFVSLEKK